LCQADYEGSSESAYRWDEWEQLCLEASQGDGELIAGVRGFWDRHLPFMHCVGSGYGYFALVTSTEGFGQVVAGFEPLFDEATAIAGSFSAFLAWLVQTPGDDLIGESLRQTELVKSDR
jgi:hypothetical protein